MAYRTKTKYPGVYFRVTERIGGEGKERSYDVCWKRDGKLVWEKVGRQYADDMTPAKASRIRAQLIEGQRETRKEKQAREEAERKAQEGRYTISRLWGEYAGQRSRSKGLKVDENRFHRYLAKPFGDREPSEIITLDVDRLRVRLLKKLSPQTVKHVLALLKRIINFGVRHGLCPAPDPQRLHIEFPKVDNVKTEDLTAEQLERLVEAMDADPNTKVADLMRLALFTGMRRGELFRLEWRDVDLERGFILIRDPKGGKSQSIPINEPARRTVEVQPRTDSPYVFPGRNDGQLSNVQEVVHRIRDRAGLPKGFRCLHGLRHVYASMLASSGEVDMYTLQKLLTHKSPQMTQRFAHLRDEALKRASTVAGDLFENLGKPKESKVVNLDDRRKR